MISNGSGGMGKNVHVEFGRTEEEVCVWSDFASKLVVWCLRTGRTVEIRDPKFIGRGSRGWGYRPRSEVEGEAARGVGGVMAVLCRNAGQDVLMLLAPRTYTVLKRVELPTVDAQGLKWSRDGRWIAIWDAASAGYSLCIYTADGHLYRTISREPSDELNEWGIEGLGIKNVEWVPGNEWLAVGGWDRRVRILSTRTFSPVVYLDHTAQICVPTVPVYTEQVDASGARSYSVTQQPVTLPKAPLEKNDNGLMKQGIGLMAFNSEGTMCATREDSTPTTVRIWDLRSLKPRTILLQHSPVKSLRWHPSNPALLFIQTAQDSPVLYLYTAPTLSNSTSLSTTVLAPPSTLDLSSSISKPAGSLPPKWSTSWLNTPTDKKPALVFGHQSYIILWPEGRDQILKFENQEADESDDSLYDILTGRTPIPPLHGSGSSGFVDVEADGGDEGGMGREIEIGYEENTGSFEDTFRERRKGVNGTRGGGARGRSVFDESGLDEMF